MSVVVDRPLYVLIVSLIVLWSCARAGTALAQRRGETSADAREDFAVVQAATLTLLGLIIGFSFSMAVSRYDQRKAYEEEEANAIGTEYLRADLLPAADGTAVRALLVRYTDQRILFYSVRGNARLDQIGADTAQLQSALWTAIRAPAAAQPTPLSALVVSGMNDVLNAEGYTAAAWRNRIPVGAWVLMLFIGACCNGLIGYGKRVRRGRHAMLFVLPLVVSISFALIADVDSPRNGIIRVAPQNMHALARSLNGP